MWWLLPARHREGGDVHRLAAELDFHVLAEDCPLRRHRIERIGQCVLVVLHENVADPRVRAKLRRIVKEIRPFDTAHRPFLACSDHVAGDGHVFGFSLVDEVHGALALHQRESFLLFEERIDHGRFVVRRVHFCEKPCEEDLLGEVFIIIGCVRLRLRDLRSLSHLDPRDGPEAPDEKTAVGEARRCPCQVLEYLPAGDLLVTLRCGFDHVNATVFRQNHEMTVDEHKKSVAGRPGFPCGLAGRDVDTGQEAAAERVDEALVIHRDRVRVTDRSCFP